MSMKKIPYNISDYRELITEDYYYVDKTMYLQDLEQADKKLIYLRPRRFGKTLFTSMMYYYYDVKSKNLFDTLFKDTYVYKNPTPYKNSYYVLRFDFSGINKYDLHGNSNLMSEFNQCIYDGISEFCEHYDLHYTIDKSLSPAAIFKDFMRFYRSSQMKETGETLELDDDNGEDIKEYTDVPKKLNPNYKMYIIIDEYDNVTNSILGGDASVFRETLGSDGFIKPFYASIKRRIGTLIDRVFVTGVCSVSVDAMTSGFNIATNISNDSEFNAMIGLTKKEVETLIKDMPKGTYNIMESNYDGYAFYKPLLDEETKIYLPLEHVFNSNSVMYYLSNYCRLNRPPEELMDKNIISSYKQIKDVIMIKNNLYYKEVLDTIFTNRKISGELNSNFDLSGEITRDDVISMLYYFGYLTIDGYNEIMGETIFKIPNKGIEKIYNEYYLAILSEYNIDLAKGALGLTINEIAYDGKIELFSKYISEAIQNASNDIYIGFNERSLQLMYYSALSQYDVFNTYLEYPLGDKKVDIMLFRNSRVVNYDIMIELKYIKKSEKNIDRLVDEKKNDGIRQLHEYGNIIDIDKTKLKKYIIIFVGSSLKVLEEVCS